MFLISAAHNCISRGKFYRIGDMTKEEAFEFLGKRRVPRDLQEKCYDFTGGRINHLKKFTANLIGEGLPFEGTEFN